MGLLQGQLGLVEVLLHSLVLLPLQALLGPLRLVLRLQIEHLPLQLLHRHYQLGILLKAPLLHLLRHLGVLLLQFTELLLGRVLQLLLILEHLAFGLQLVQCGSRLLAQLKLLLQLLTQCLIQVLEFLVLACHRLLNCPQFLGGLLIALLLQKLELCQLRPQLARLYRVLQGQLVNLLRRALPSHQRLLALLDRLDSIQSILDPGRATLHIRGHLAHLRFSRLHRILQKHFLDIRLLLPDSLCFGLLLLSCQRLI